MVPPLNSRQAHNLHEAEAPHHRAPRLLVISLDGILEKPQSFTPWICLLHLLTGISLSFRLSSTVSPLFFFGLSLTAEDGGLCVSLLLPSLLTFCVCVRNVTSDASNKCRFNRIHIHPC